MLIEKDTKRKGCKNCIFFICDIYCFFHGKYIDDENYKGFFQIYNTITKPDNLKLVKTGYLRLSYRN